MTAIISKIQNEIFKKFQTEIVVALALILLGAGVDQVLTDSDTVIIDSDIDVYKLTSQEIDSKMQDVIDNPTAENLESMQNDLFYTYYPWAQRTEGGKQGDFIQYLEACNQVIISLDQTGEADLSEMEKAKEKIM